MDARGYLQRQGWQGDGHSLGISGNGIKKPLLISFKDNALGIGSKKQKEKQADQWWLRAFDTALKDFGTGKLSTLNQVTKLGVGRGGLYGFFVRGESLKGTIDADDVVSDASSILVEREASLPAAIMSIPVSPPVVDATKKSKKRKLEEPEVAVEVKKSKKSKKENKAAAELKEPVAPIIAADDAVPRKQAKPESDGFIGLEFSDEAQPGHKKKDKKTKTGMKSSDETDTEPRPETFNEKMRREKKERKAEDKKARKALKQANKTKPIDPVTVTSFDKERSLTQCKKAVKALKAHIKAQTEPDEVILRTEATLAQEACDSIAVLRDFLNEIPTIRTSRLEEFETLKQKRDNAKKELDRVIEVAHGFEGHIRNIEKKLKPTQPKSLEVVAELEKLVKELKVIQLDAQKEHETRAADFRATSDKDPNAEKIRRQAKAAARREKKQAEKLAKLDEEMPSADPSPQTEGMISLAIPDNAGAPVVDSEEATEDMSGLHPSRLAMLARDPSPPTNRGSAHAYKKKMLGKRERKALKAAQKGSKPQRRGRH